MTIVKFKKWNCKIKISRYGVNDRLALQLNDFTNGEVVAEASINLSDFPLGENEIAIKNHSENEGILQVLVDSKIVSEPKYYVDSGFVTIPVCDINLEMLD